MSCKPKKKFEEPVVSHEVIEKNDDDVKEIVELAALDLAR